MLNRLNILVGVAYTSRLAEITHERQFVTADRLKQIRKGRKAKTMNEIIKENLENQIMEVLKGLDDSEMVNIWNEYCDRNDYYDDRIYHMEELDEIMNGQDAIYILQRAFYGHDEWSDESEFNPNREYFTFNGYGNLISMDAIGFNEYANKFMCDYIDEDAIVNYILDNMDALECDEITEILDDYENGID